MQIEILILTLIFWIATGSMSLILFISTQQGQWLGKWQNVLRKLDLSGTKTGLILSKIGGYCELCFSHFIGFLSFWIYLYTNLHLIGLPVINIFIWFIWYLIYISISTNVNLYFITKLFKK